MKEESKLGRAMTEFEIEQENIEKAFERVINLSKKQAKNLVETLELILTVMPMEKPEKTKLSKFISLIKETLLD